MVNNHNYDRMANDAKLALLKTVPTQILTMYALQKNKMPLHIELDSGANLNYCREKDIKELGFHIYPNNQSSKLGDGVTKIQGIGEIRQIFYRNSFQVKFEAIVCRQLSSAFIGGTPFLKENNIEQDFSRNMIKIDK